MPPWNCAIQWALTWPIQFYLEELWRERKERTCARGTLMKSFLGAKWTVLYQNMPWNQVWDCLQEPIWSIVWTSHFFISGKLKILAIWEKLWLPWSWTRKTWTKETEKKMPSGMAVQKIIYFICCRTIFSSQQGLPCHCYWRNSHGSLWRKRNKSQRHQEC